MPKQIKLTQGKFAIVDNEDFEFLNKWKWYAQQGGNTFYAARKSKSINGKQKVIRMHRAIIKPNIGLEVDHVNRNGLDNRKINIRECTRSQNSLNARIRTDNTSGCKGVCFDKRSGKYAAQIKINGKRKHVGLFSTVEEAAKAFIEFEINNSIVR